MVAIIGQWLPWECGYLSLTAFQSRRLVQRWRPLWEIKDRTKQKRVDMFRLGDKGDGAKESERDDGWASSQPALQDWVTRTISPNRKCLFFNSAVLFLLHCNQSISSACCLRLAWYSCLCPQKHISTHTHTHAYTHVHWPHTQAK